MLFGRPLRAEISRSASAQRLVEATAEPGPAMLIGTIVHDGGLNYNAVLLADGVVVHLTDGTTVEGSHALMTVGTTLSRLTGPAPDAWAEAAGRWSDLGDRWWTAVARLREAEAAASTALWLMRPTNTTTGVRKAVLVLPRSSLMLVLK